MKLALPRKRTILAWHRWMGIGASLFLAVVALTGLALNHTERLGLDRIQIHSGLILQRYGMATTESIRSYTIQGEHTLSALAGQLFYNTQAICSASAPIGIQEGDPITTVITTDELVYLSPEGELIERVSFLQLPFESLQAVGQSPDGRAVLISEEGNFTPDPNWIEFETYTGRYEVAPLQTKMLAPKEQEALLESFQGSGVTLYRVLLDLHSGRLFGWGGRTLMDLSAVAILLLISSGIFGWLRKSRRHSTTPSA
ncbi:PepSY-associated TM helix domain-containing protein [Coraliomargarita parva]|uniref:PepSY-associated TM helix domain-containing protein n=1 Tax=Coraliomargarita parva TaxID=3014050 RepID=UPI0022B567C8|nr:PepSY-associated TM helix domain-containing protein [Coraliomargarita parva]